LNLKNVPKRLQFSHPASRASFIAFLSGQETKKEALHKSALAFEVAVAPNLGLVIPVYSHQTGFSSASINFYEKPMVETEPTGCKKNMAVKGPAKGDRAKMLDDALLTCKHQSASIKCFTSGDFRIFTQGHWSRKILMLNVRSRSQKSCKSTLPTDCADRRPKPNLPSFRYELFKARGI